MQVERKERVSCLKKQRSNIYDSLDERVGLVKNFMEICYRCSDVGDGNRIFEELDRFEIEDSEKNLGELVKGMWNKKQTVDSLRGEDLTMLNELIKAGKMENENIDMSVIKNISYGPFWVAVVFDSNIFDNLTDDENCQGQYLVGTPFIIIRDGVDYKDVFNHELKHLILNGLIDYYGGDFNSSNLFMSFIKNKEIKNNIVEKEMIERKLNPNLCLDDLHNEFLASDIGNIILEGSRDLDRDFWFYFNNFFTASDESEEILFWCDQIEKNESIDKNIKMITKEFNRGFVMVWKRMLENLIYSVKLIDEYDNKIKDEAISDFVSLTYILKPTKYRHISKFLEYKYGN